jgi:hypothetical protein
VGKEILGMGKMRDCRQNGHMRRWMDNIKMDLTTNDVRVWTECMWLRTGNSDGVL